MLANIPIGFKISPRTVCSVRGFLSPCKTCNLHTTHHAHSRQGKWSWNTFAVCETAVGASLGGVVIRRGWIGKMSPPKAGAAGRFIARKGGKHPPVFVKNPHKPKRFPRFFASPWVACHSLRVRSSFEVEIFWHGETVTSPSCCRMGVRFCEVRAEKSRSKPIFPPAAPALPSLGTFLGETRKVRANPHPLRYAQHLPRGGRHGRIVYPPATFQMMVGIDKCFT